MSTGPTTTEQTYRAQPRPLGRLRGFWQRVSEGRQIEDLWSQFAADARASYGFYGHDVDWEQIQKLPRWKRPLRITKEFFWALLMKLTPARRVLILFSATTLRIGNQIFFDLKMEGFAVLIFLILLALELADKVTMKRDLEIAREIQTWLVP